MIDIIEHIRHKNAFIACKRNRFREVRFINIITASPRTVHPMCTGFQNIMLEIVLMEQEQSFSTSLFRKFFQTCPIPCIGTVQIIFTQAFPGNALTATSERLFIKGAPYISIAPTDAFMVIPATIIPKSVILVKYEYIIPLHKVDDWIYTVCQSQSLTTGNKAGNCRTCFLQIVGSELTIPPRSSAAFSHQQGPIHLNTPICNNHFR